MYELKTELKGFNAHMLQPNEHASEVESMGGLATQCAKMNSKVIRK